MSKGYLILARTSEEQKAAAACAYSIRIHNPKASVTLVVDDINNIITDYEEPFEYIIELPYPVNDDLRANEWQLHDVTQYDQNIVIDCYSLVCESHDALWDYLSHYDMCYGTSVMNFKGEAVSKQLEWHNEHDITYVNSDCFYFKKNSTLTSEFFAFAKLYMTRFVDVMSTYIESQYIPTYYDSNLIHSLIIAHIDIINDVTPYHDDILKIIDMDVVTNELLTNDRIECNWSDYLNVWIGDHARIKIQNFAINHTIAYKNVTFVTDEIYNEYRNYFRNKTSMVD